MGASVQFGAAAVEVGDVAHAVLGQFAGERAAYAHDHHVFVEAIVRGDEAAVGAVGGNAAA